MQKKLLFTILLLCIFLAALFFGQQDIDLETIRAMVADVSAWRGRNPLVFALIFFLVYVGIAAFSLPLAVWITLAAGAIFGFWWGLVIVSFASTIGASLAFLASRYFLGDWAQKKLATRSAAIFDGIERDGAFYLFSLRLIPVIPFFAVNLLMGLTRLPARKFYLVSQLGMLPGSAAYVNAGTQLGKLDSISGIVSPSLLGAFALLGLLPWIARFILRIFKSRKVYEGFEKPKSFDRNMVVIGGGAAGLVSAYIGATVRAKVTLVEAHKMGGDCLNFGCVPSKALIKSAKLAHQMRNADHYGLNAQEPKLSFKKIFARIHDVIKAIEPHDSVERYTKMGVEVLEGYAKIIDPWHVEIAMNDGTVKKLSTRSIVIAAGAAPFVPPIPGIEKVNYLTSDTLWEHFAKKDQPPKRLVILGGGPIGTELAQSFARLGSEVTQVEMMDRLLGREDPEVSEIIQSALEDDGVKILTKHKAIGFGLEKGEKWVELEAEGKKKKVKFDEVIIALGRQARLTGYGLEELGVNTNRTIETNEYLETIFPNIYAAGDVAGPYQFTHTASHQAWFASVNALFGTFRRFKVDYRVIPWASFTDPEVAHLGVNELEAKEKGIEYEVTKYGLDDLDRAIADGAAHGFVKVLTVPGKDKILGVTIVGAHAGDLMAEFVLAMKYKLGLNKILSTIHTYPTLAEANKFAAGEWRRARINEHLMGWLERYHNWRRG